ncbi:unnamed protein product [Linum trigynum]|uniref:RNase H type-1 domain-containing protein n=1 Tax=Linum trigynum TaxID=586398 RepID=A0AAV2EW00_9ROSI
MEGGCCLAATSVFGGIGGETRQAQMTPVPFVHLDELFLQSVNNFPELEMQITHSGTKAMISLSDALAVVQHLTTSDANNAHVGAILRGVIILLQELPLVSVALTPREANRAAHAVARNALCYFGSCSVRFNCSYLL